MPSFVWDRDTEEAWSEPYEYGGQEQFHREAYKVLSLIKLHYAEKICTLTEMKKLSTKQSG